MKWWILARSEELAEVVHSGMSPKDFARKLKIWGFKGLWYEAYHHGRPVWASGWCDVRSDMGPYLAELGEKGIDTTAVVTCFHNPDLFADDVSSHPVLMEGTMSNGQYRPICPTHPGHLPVLAGRTEAVACSAKPKGIAFDALHCPVHWERDQSLPKIPVACLCTRCLSAAQRGDVGLCAVEGLEESQDIPKYQCKKVKKSKKKSSTEKIMTAWMIWRSAHISQVALDLKRLSGRRRRIMHIVPPLQPDRLQEDLDIRAGQNLAHLVKEKFVLAPMLYAPMLRKDDVWVEECILAFQQITRDLAPALCPPGGADVGEWKRAWARQMRRLSIEEAVVRSLGAWMKRG